LLRESCRERAVCARRSAPRERTAWFSTTITSRPLSSRVWWMKGASGAAAPPRQRRTARERRQWTGVFLYAHSTPGHRHRIVEHHTQPLLDEHVTTPRRSTLTGVESGKDVSGRHAPRERGRRWVSPGRTDLSSIGAQGQTEEQRSRDHYAFEVSSRLDGWRPEPRPPAETGGAVNAFADRRSTHLGRAVPEGASSSAVRSVRLAPATVRDDRVYGHELLPDGPGRSQVRLLKAR